MILKKNTTNSTILRMYDRYGQTSKRWDTNPIVLMFIDLKRFIIEIFNSNLSLKTFEGKLF